MGFLDGASTTKTFPATVLTQEFQARCMLNVIGLVQTFLNDEQRAVFPLQKAAVYGMERGNPATSMQIPELFVRKSMVHVIMFEQTFSSEDMGLMPRAERVAVYTSRYVIQGEFHMGTDALISDFIDASKAFFVGAMNVSVFPLFAPQAAVVHNAPLAYIHKDQVRMHHLI